MKKISTFSLIIMLISMLTNTVFALEPMENFYVNDYLGVLSTQQTTEMVNKAKILSEQNGVQVVTVITPNYIGTDPHAYAVQLFNEFGIGSEKNNNGILLYVAVDDGKVEIVTGKGMDGVLPDSKAGAIVDSFIQDAKDSSLGEAIVNTQSQLVDVGARLDTEGADYSKNTKGAFKVSGLFGTSVILVIVMIVVFLVMFLSAKKSGVQNEDYDIFDSFNNRRLRRYNNNFWFFSGTRPYRGNSNSNGFDNKDDSSFGNFGGDGSSSGGGAGGSFNSNGNSSNNDNDDDKFGGFGGFGGGNGGSFGGFGGGGGSSSGGGAGGSFK